MSRVEPTGHVCVVGGSLAAATAANELRRAGHRGRVTLVSDEGVPPYARPPLSKGVLSGDDSPESTYLPACDDVDVVLGNAARGLDMTVGRLLLADGATIPFDGLVIATGARARALPGDGEVFTLRSLHDAGRLRRAMGAAETMIVVGGGPLAMELASAATELGLAVTVLCNQPPLQRQLGARLATEVHGFATAAGVRVVIDPHRLHATRGPDGGTVVASATGAHWTADLVVAAVGCTPNVEWLSGSGLVCDTNGLAVDECLVAADRVVAAGDVVALGARRTPLWLNAIDQACTATANLLSDEPRPFTALPFFWTEAFGHKLRMVGTISTDAELTVERQPRGSLYRWHRDGNVVAAAALDMPMPVGRLKRLVHGS